MNDVEREPVETRVLNPTASEASYKPKQRSYSTRRFGYESAAPKRTRPTYSMSQKCLVFEMLQDGKNNGL